MRKLNTIGARVMLLSWDFEYDNNQKSMVTKTSQRLINEATYPIRMETVIDSKSPKDQSLIDNIFMGHQKPHGESGRFFSNTQKKIIGTIFSLNSNENGRFGFIHTNSGENIFFGESSYQGDYDSLRKGDEVEFELGENKMGRCALDVVSL